jgi:concentrative nucleoside transporter, CNT family
MPPQIMSFVGMAAIVGFCFLLSKERSRIDWRQVLWGLGLQYFFALIILKTYPEAIFSGARAFFDGITATASHGGKFLFGELMDRQDFVMLQMGAVIVFITSILGILNYTRILPAVIYVLARATQRTLRTSGAETTAAFMFILMGIETVAGLKKLVSRMTRSELFTVMTCFMANIAGSVMAVYVGVFGANPGYVLSATLMHALAGLAISKMLVPETETPETRGKVAWEPLLSSDHGVVEAAANGALDGLRLAATIAAILLAFVSIIYMLDRILGLFGTSFATLGGYAFAPVAYLLGVPWEDCMNAGHLIAVKTVFNEWLAYSKMQEMVQAQMLSPRAVLVLTFALCSFANFGSLAILIGGVAAIAPERKEEVTALGMRSLLAGLLAGFMTAAVAGTLHGS